MKNLLLFTIVCFYLNLTCILSLSGQSSKKMVAVKLESQKIEYALFNSVVEILNNSSKDYEFTTNHHNLVLTITPAVQKKGMKTIEGMESKKVGKGVVSFKVKNEALGLDSLLKTEYSISGKTETETNAEIIDKLNNDKQLLNQVSDVVTHLIKASATDCKKNLVKVDELETAGKNKDALVLLLKIENTFTDCKSAIQSRKTELTKKYEKEVCEKLLYEAKIFINSGVEFQMNKAVGLLLQIPPTAACKDDAIKLSEELSAKMSVSKSNIDRLKEYQKMINYSNIKKC